MSGTFKKLIDVAQPRSGATNNHASRRILEWRMYTRISTADFCATVHKELHKVHDWWKHSGSGYFV
jgi:hypothetical protein